MIRDDIKAATIASMKAHDSARTATLRMVSSAIKNKDIELRDHYRKESQARGRWRASSASAGYSSAARRAGDRAGKQARLGGSPELPGARSRLKR